jgi:zinc transport system substrate-binding protein
VALLVLLAGVATWLGVKQSRGASDTSGKLQVMASFYPVYDLARQIGGEVAVVSNVTPAGAEAHDFEPSPQTLTTIYRADLFIYHDEAMDPWVAKFTKEYSGVEVRAIEGIKLHSAEGHSDDDNHNHLHDPHIWTDPVLASKMVDNILAGFIAADPTHQSVYRQNAATLQSDLSKLDREFRQQLASCKYRTVVTSHAAYHYLADRYNLTILPISGLTPTQEPNPGKLAELSKLVKEQGITTIFFESQANPHLAQTLAQETGAKTAILDPIEGINQSSSHESYVSIQEKNLTSLKTALACR